MKNILQRASEIKRERESFDHGCNCKHTESRNSCGRGRTTAATTGKCTNNVHHSTLKNASTEGNKKDVQNISTFGKPASHRDRAGVPNSVPRFHTPGAVSHHDKQVHVSGPSGCLLLLMFSSVFQRQLQGWEGGKFAMAWPHLEGCG